MKQLIYHLLKTNLEEILKMSVMNCHIKGLHSIMLLNSPGKTIRLYITTKNHTLWNNYENAITLAFHPHHCELTLHSIYGEFTNINAKLSNEIYGNEYKVYDSWKYNSQIKNQTPIGFEKVGEAILVQEKQKTLGIGESIYLRAAQIHTVACPENTLNAWLVYEGRENPSYQSICYSNQDLTKTDSSELYQKMSESVLKYLLKSIRLI